MYGENFGKTPYNMKESCLFGHSKQVSFILYGVFPTFSPYIDPFTVKIGSWCQNRSFGTHKAIFTVNVSMYEEKVGKTSYNMNETCL